MQLPVGCNLVSPRDLESFTCDSMGGAFRRQESCNAMTSNGDVKVE